MLPPLAVARDFISTWEGGHSLARTDSGNWSTGVCGRGVCIGSNRGVTPRTLARARGVPVASITREVMAALTLDEAARIALRFFYEGNGLDRLPWDPVMASVMDFGWGAGPTEAVIILQRFVGAQDDGATGPATAQAYLRFLAAHGLANTAIAWADRRVAFYRGLAAHDPNKAESLQGWINRTAYFRPGGGWWKRMGAA